MNFFLKLIKMRRQLLDVSSRVCIGETFIELTHFSSSKKREEQKKKKKDTIQATRKTKKKAIPQESKARQEMKSNYISVILEEIYTRKITSISPFLSPDSFLHLILLEREQLLLLWLPLSFSSLLLCS
jgi:hypothetical protein